MKKSLLLIPVCALAASCSTERGMSIVDDAGYTHYTKSMHSDHRGSYSFPAKREPTGNKVFIFDPKVAAWAAYDREGNRLHTGSASGGKDFCEDAGKPCRTVTGTYRIYSKKGPDCTSSLYPIETHGGARMPYCMHFHGGYSIHAAYEVPNSNVSHGCIRVLPSAAKWLNEEFADIGTTVIVKSY
jgi:hypothetical protein